MSAPRPRASRPDAEAPSPRRATDPAPPGVHPPSAQPQRPAPPAPPLAQPSAEDALRQELQLTKARLDDLARLVSDWIWEVDRDGSITSVTPRVMEVLGYHPVELIGRPFAELIGEHGPIVAGGANRRARPFRDQEVRITDRRGEPRTFRLSGIPVFGSADGRFLGYRGTAQDVTELKARETALLEAKNAAEESDRTKSQFLAQMSHELRTPLNAIIGFSEIMEGEQLGPLGTDQYRGYAADIASSARHLSQVINDVLDVAKLEAGKFQLHEEVCCPQDIAAQAVRIVQPRAEQAGVSLVLAGARADRLLRADGRKLLQILLNLLSNAVKFTPDGGRVDVAAHRDEAGGFLFVVADTGIGMSDADQKVALSPFGQVDSSLARRYEGTGLGLPLSKALTELHQGELTIDSAPQAGTRISVRLPASRVMTTK